MYWSGLVSDQFFFNHILFYPFTGAGDSGAVTLQGGCVLSRFYAEVSSARAANRRTRKRNSPTRVKFNLDD